MPTRITLTLILAAVSIATTGCTCVSSFSPCGACNYSGDCCASCGCPEASCCCPDPCCDVATCGCPEASCCCPDVCCDVASCGCPEASCCCPNSCCTTVGCGSPVVGQCRLLQRIRNALCGCSGCSSQTYWSEWHCDPPCNCSPCDCSPPYNNGSPSGGCPSCAPHAGLGNRGGYYAASGRRPARLSKKKLNFEDELRFAEKESGTTYR